MIKMRISQYYWELTKYLNKLSQLLFMYFTKYLNKLSQLLFLQIREEKY